MAKAIVMTFLLLALATLSMQQTLVGGYQDISTEHVLQLTQNEEFAKVEKFARDYFRENQNGELGELIKVSTQVVAGTNYRLTFRTQNGEKTITVFSQPWTNTIKVLEWSHPSFIIE